LNYRHAFHAGNFADLVKHAVLLQLLQRLATAGPLSVIDTHAGRGLYDLAGIEAKKSGEAEAGVVRLMAERTTPAVFAPLVAAVRRLNGQGPVRRYPGSPVLIADALRPGDDYLACELRADEHGALKSLMKGRAGVRTLCADGYDLAAQPPAGRVLIVIDPPFEKPDDYSRIVETLDMAMRRNDQTQALVWLPLKDLETFDAFLRDLEDAGLGAGWVTEARMRPLTDPMKMNGCALVLVGDVPGMGDVMREASGWVARTLGQPGGSEQTYPLVSA
jgi:23S rRNA (adenine2030-N6)-methyltransferase